jgi:hypothetical protein
VLDIDVSCGFFLDLEAPPFIALENSRPDRTIGRNVRPGLK